MKSKVKSMKIHSHVLKLESELSDFESSRTYESLLVSEKEKFHEKIAVFSSMIGLLRQLGIP